MSEAFENQLRKLRPGDPSADRDQLMYRCGWAAALASLEASEGNEETDRLRISKHSAMRAKAWWLPFGGGSLAGIAATLLFILMVGTLDRNASNTGPEIGTSNLAQQYDPNEQQSESAIDDSVDSVIEQVPGVQSDHQLALVLGWNGLPLSARVDLEAPVAMPNSLDTLGALSVVARRRFADVRVDSSLVVVRPVNHSPQKQLPSIGSFLFGDEGKEFY